MQKQPTCQDCERLADKDPDYVESCHDPKKDYKCFSGYWEHGRLYPENELAWTVHQKKNLLGPGWAEVLGLKEELGPMEMDKLIDRLMVIEDTVNRYHEANQPKPKKAKK